jgi:2-succinyl-5-enolpyruvyl-6-hydroxy-3-cyclohexene-1-carboxylate synthase
VHHLDHVLDAGAGRGFEPAAVVQLGGRITAKSVQQLLDARASTLVVVAPGADRIDPGHRATWRVEAGIDAWCEAMIGRVPARTAGDDLARLQAASRRAATAIESDLDGEGPLSEPFVARWLTRHAPAGSGLYLSSSMPVRDVQAFGPTGGPPLRVASNRGASGIDGVLASAAGFAAGSEQPAVTTLLIGDLALLHDLGSLALLRDVGARRTVIAVVLNNGGGSIFSMLPIARSEDVFTPWFDTPHDTSFGGVAADFGIAHARIESRAGLDEHYRAAVRRGGPTLLEVRSSLDGNREDHRRLRRAIEHALEATP